MKNLNEQKVFDNLRQEEKAILLFKVVSGRDDNLFDKVVSSGEQKTWIVRNHEAREILQGMFDVALSWGVNYWKVLFQYTASMGYLTVLENRAANGKEDLEAINQVSDRLTNASYEHDAYLQVMKRLCDAYNMDAKTFLQLAGVVHGLLPLVPEPTEHDKNAIDSFTNRNYLQFTMILDGAMRRAG